MQSPQRIPNPGGAVGTPVPERATRFSGFGVAVSGSFPAEIEEG